MEFHGNMTLKVYDENGNEQLSLAIQYLNLDYQYKKLRIPGKEEAVQKLLDSIRIFANHRTSAGA